MRILFFFFLTWIGKAAENAHTDLGQMAEKFEEVETAKNEKLASDSVMTEADESEENVKWNGYYRGFVLKYYPDPSKGLRIAPELQIRPYNWGPERHRRRHWTLKPWALKSWKDCKKPYYELSRQNFEYDSEKRIYNRLTKQCLHVHNEDDKDDDLTWWPCVSHHNPQKFWFGQYGEDGNFNQNAIHIFAEGRANSRRRRLCVDMGGGRLYLHPCHNGRNQRWLKSDATTTSTTTSTTTTTTVLEEVKLITASFPEKIEWIIDDVITKKPVPGCSGKAYSRWYSEHKTGCKLTKGRRYKITCFDKMYREGWAEGYLKIGKKKICNDFHWDQKKASKVVMYP